MKRNQASFRSAKPRAPWKKALAVAGVFLPMTVLAQEQASASTDMSDMTKFSILLAMLVFQIILLFTISNIIKNLAGTKALWTKYLNSKGISLGAIALLLIGASPVYAQDGGSGGFVLDSSLENLLLSLNAFLLVTIIFLLFTLRNLVRTLTASQQEEAEAAVSKSWLAQIMTSMTDAVPVEEEEEIMTDHDYDGITELDNNLPPWWVMGFYITIFFSVVYFVYYQVYLDGNMMEREYTEAMEEARIQKEAYLASLANSVDETNVTLLTDASSLEQGAEIFKINCVTCHAAGGGGSVGPNLTDEYWIHGGGIQNVFKTVKYGVPAKGMIAWEDQLGPQKMQQVSSYILSLQGSNPPGALDPQGELWVETAEEPEAMPADSSAMPADTAAVAEGEELAAR